MTGTDVCVADTSCGRVAGEQTDGVMRFLGIPYAQPPVGPLRFASPRPVRPRTGLRAAVAPAAAPPQTIGGIVSWIYPQPQVVDEDCLTVNVWTPATSGKRPVMLWLYGGAFQAGYNGLPLSDATRLAHDGDMVVVAPNYRVGLLGFAGHPALRDPVTGAEANWGLQDQACALEWIHANIAAFGGDPDRITVMGQSAGAISAILLAQHRETAVRFRQLVLCSVPYIAPPDVAVPEDLAVYVADLAQHFDTSVEGLRNVPVQRLVAEEPAFFSRYSVRTPTGRFRRWPTLDGLTVDAWPGTCSLGGMPVLIGNTRTESSFSLDLYDVLQDRQLTVPLPHDADTLRHAVGRMVASRYIDPTRQPDAHELLQRFDLHARAASAPGELFLDLHSDAAYRHPTWRVAQRAVSEGNRAVYYYDFGQPLAPPARGTPHNADVPFWFGTHDAPFYLPKFGAAAHVARLSLVMRQLLTSFVHAGRPHSEHAPAWPALLDSGTPQVMRLGHDGHIASVGDMPDFARLRELDPLYFP
jgi:para-nitrobenzyl esterase